MKFKNAIITANLKINIIGSNEIRFQMVLKQPVNPEAAFRSVVSFVHSNNSHSLICVADTKAPL